MTKSIPIAVTVICLAALSVGGWFVFRYALFPVNPNVTTANFQRIQIGMQLEEVETIFGTSDDDEAQGVTFGETRYWSAPHGSMQLHFCNIMHPDPTRPFGVVGGTFRTMDGKTHKLTRKGHE